MKNAKMAASGQNGWLPVSRRKLVQETFVCVLVDSICIPNFVCLRQSERNGYLRGVAMATGKVKSKVFLIIINVTGRKMKPKQTKSRSDEYFRRSTQMKNAKMAASGQNGRLPVGRRKSVQETFLCVLVYLICVPNFVCLRQSWRNGYLCGVAMATGKVKSKVFLIIINLTGV